MRASAVLILIGLIGQALRTFHLIIYKDIK